MPPMCVPLNGATAKEQAILRYGAVRLPNIRGVLTRWDVYRLKWGLQWSDLVIFKKILKVVSITSAGALGRPSFWLRWSILRWFSSC
jgi:hypothetical protein